MLDTNLTHDLVIGLDRSDRKADLHFINTTTGETRSETLASSPENLRQWLLNLRQKYPKANVGICLEQPAVSYPPPGGHRRTHRSDQPATGPA